MAGWLLGRDGEAVAEALSGCRPAQVHAIMVCPDALLVALDQLPGSNPTAWSRSTHAASVPSAPRAALAMDSTVNEGSDKTGVPAPSASRSREIHLRQGPPQCQDMMIPAEPASALSNQARPFP